MHYYTKDHQWFCPETKKVGLSQFAKAELGEVVYLKLPPLGQELKEGEEMAILESTKSALDVYAPYSGTVTKINEKAIDHINEDPENLGWLVEITPEHPIKTSDFLDLKSYQELLNQ